MELFLYIVFFVSCLVLIATVLLQPGKTDAGALFTSGVSSAALNPRGTASVLSKLTIVAASTFMVSALLLSLPAITGDVSVLETTSEAPAQEGAQSEPAPEPQAAEAAEDKGEGKDGESKEAASKSEPTKDEGKAATSEKDASKEKK